MTLTMNMATTMTLTFVSQIMSDLHQTFRNYDYDYDYDYDLCQPNHV